MTFDRTWKESVLGFGSVVLLYLFAFEICWNQFEKKKKTNANFIIDKLLSLSILRVVCQRDGEKTFDLIFETITIVFLAFCLCLRNSLSTMRLCGRPRGPRKIKCFASLHARREPPISKLKLITSVGQFGAERKKHEKDSDYFNSRKNVIVENHEILNGKTYEAGKNVWPEYSHFNNNKSRPPPHWTKETKKRIQIARECFDSSL